MTTELVWEDPPQGSNRTYHKHGPIAEQLKGRKGAWAKVAVCSSLRMARVMASTIRLAKAKPYEPRGDFEATHRAVDGEFRVYARYLGDGPSE